MAKLLFCWIQVVNREKLLKQDKQTFHFGLIIFEQFQFSFEYREREIERVRWRDPKTWNQGKEAQQENEYALKPKTFAE